MASTLGPNGEIYSPTILPSVDFDPEKDAETLEQSMKGAGTDEKAMISVLCRRTSQERGKIAVTYKSMFGKELYKQVKSETGKDFGSLMCYLCLDGPMLKAMILYDCIAGMGTDEDGLIEILCSATNTEITAIKEAYQEVLVLNGKDPNQKNLEKDIIGDCSGLMQRLLVALVQAERKEPSEELYQTAQTEGVACLIDMASGTATAEMLYNAGEGKLGTDESMFIRILAHESVWQLAAIDQMYLLLSNKTLRDAVKSETSGDFGRALTSTLDFSLNRAATFATHLYKAMKGMGTNEATLMRILATRAEIDMNEIKDSYNIQYNKTLAAAISNEVSGDFEKSLLALIGE